MIIFILLNTSSLTLIPSTAASLRLKHGAQFPMDILTCVLVTSVLALLSGLIAAKALNCTSALSCGKLKEVTD